MRISTKGRYGLRFLLDVAVHEGAGPVSLSAISKRQGISQKYLWQVVNPLRTAGILRAVRGAQGGYELTRPPAAISLYDIVQALEGEGSLVPCLSSPQSCERAERCAAREAWFRVQETLQAALREVTLGQLVERYRSLETDQAGEYVI